MLISEVKMLIVNNFINGEFISLESYIDSYEPSTGKVWAKIPNSGAFEVSQAVLAARQAFPMWSSLTLAERSKYLLKIADILESRLDEFAKAESRDQGKTITFAQTVDIPRAVLNFRTFATSMLHHTNSSSVLESFNALNYVVRSPIGVAGLISPWNLPLYLLTFKLAPALAAGNTVVAKPSEFTSVTAWMLCKVFVEAGLPPGVVNVVFGTGPLAGDALVRDPHVPLISFTGSTLTGQKIMEASAPFTKKLSLEMGGKNPCIIFEDANLDDCIPTTIRSSFSNQGEICLCSSRIYVHNNIFHSFVEKFVDQTRKLVIGPPKDSSSFMGPLVSEQHLEKVKGYIHLAEKEGATVLCGEGVDKPQELPEEYRNGYFMQPTILTDIADNSACMQEEIFGPVTCIVPFHEEEEVIARANSVKYGLSACVWSRDVGRCHRVAHKLQVGTVWTNCWMIRDLHMPFGGSKSSGLGREGITESWEFYTETKTICVKMD